MDLFLLPHVRERLGLPLTHPTKYRDDTRKNLFDLERLTMNVLGLLLSNRRGVKNYAYVSSGGMYKDSDEVCFVCPVGDQERTGY